MIRDPYSHHLKPLWATWAAFSFLSPVLGMWTCSLDNILLFLII